MMRIGFVAVAALSAALVFAAGPADESKLPDAARTDLEKTDQIDVMSLDPAGGETSKDAFHAYKVLGKVTVKDSAVLKEIAEAVEKGVAEGGPIAKCFEPRHGLHIVYKDKTYDFLICYQCSQIQISTGSPEPETVATSGASKAALDNALKSAETAK
jgi:hypothetical protein